MARVSNATLALTLLTVCPLAIAVEDTSELRRELSVTVDRIEKIASDQTCFDSTQCTSLAIGQQACGGPARLVTYSTQLGHETVVELLNLAERSKILQSRVNEAEFAISTCGMTRPGPLMCSEGHCIELSKSFGEENVKLAGTFLASTIFTTKLSELSEKISQREISQEVRQRIIFRSALRISDCILAELTSDPESRDDPLLMR